MKQPIPLTVCLILLMLMACSGRVSQQSGNTNAIIDLQTESTEVGETMLLITLKDSNGNPINDATLHIRGDMIHAGMTPVLVEDVTGGQNGIYTIPFTWTMGGDWIVTVEGILADGRSVSHRFNLSITSTREGIEHE